jgi:hypothetical protein
MKKRCVSETWNISKIKTFWDGNHITVNQEEYQRESCWGKAQKGLFIDSLIRGYDIPKIYFNDITENQDKYEIVDGQQRTLTILEFIDNQFSLPSLQEVDELSFPINKTNIINGKTYGELSGPEKNQFDSIGLDIVEMIGYDEDEIKDIFIRHQMGSPLKGAEKRKALLGNVSGIIEKISKLDIFNAEKYLNFKNKRASFRDSADKLLIEFINKDISGVSSAELTKMYKNNKGLDENHESVNNLRNSLKFLANSFDGKNPRLGKAELRRLTWIVFTLRKSHNLDKLKDEFADAFNKFNTERFEMSERIKKGEIDPDKIPVWHMEYLSKLRSDDVSGQKFIDEILKKYLIENIKGLTNKDNKRAFTAEQKWYMYHRDNKQCQIYAIELDLDESHADHIHPYSDGGKTVVENGQITCINCNLAKGSKVINQ